MDNTKLIRQLLIEFCKECLIQTKQTSRYIEPDACSPEKCKIIHALALLPCDTCNGTKLVPTPQSRGFGKAHEIMDTCPDCQPCKTCGGAGKKLEYAKACPECGCEAHVFANSGGEGYRQCAHCLQEWWIDVKYAIGDKPCPDCQPCEKEPLYAIAQDDGNGGYGFWYGPTFLEETLEVKGRDSNSVIFRLNKEGTHELIYRWIYVEWVPMLDINIS